MKLSSSQPALVRWCDSQLPNHYPGFSPPVVATNPHMTALMGDPFAEVRLEEAILFRRQSALYRWDPEWDCWTAMQRLEKGVRTAYFHRQSPRAPADAPTWPSGEALAGRRPTPALWSRNGR